LQKEKHRFQFGLFVGRREHMIFFPFPPFYFSLPFALLNPYELLCVVRLLVVRRRCARIACGNGSIAAISMFFHARHSSNALRSSSSVRTGGDRYRVYFLRFLFLSGNAGARKYPFAGTALGC
jgi:hypothetical protein